MEVIAIKRVFTRREFVVFKIDDNFLLINTNKPFDLGHTHLRSFNACISIIKLIERKQLPKSKSRHFMESILRVCDDNLYSEKIRQLRG
jgi:hypothetical protein